MENVALNMNKVNKKKWTPNPKANNESEYV